MRNILIYFAIKYEGDYKKILNAIKNKEEVPSDKIEKIKSLNIKALTCIDKEYPSCFKNCYQPPFVLFYKGDISLINNQNTLSVVGSRNPSEYGKNATKKILNDFLSVNDYIIVSGLARGIDALSHQMALKNNRRTIAILGCGIDICYPQENNILKNEIIKNGLVLSEYPFSTQPKKEFFPFRNRLIASLGKALLVGDASIKSGTQITVRHALEYGKDILAIPHDIFSNSFCNDLIKQGAILISSKEDLENELF